MTSAKFWDFFYPLPTCHCPIHATYLYYCKVWATPSPSQCKCHLCMFPEPHFRITQAIFQQVRPIRPQRRGHKGFLQGEAGALQDPQARALRRGVPHDGHRQDPKVQDARGGRQEARAQGGVQDEELNFYEHARCGMLVYRDVHLLRQLGWVDLDFGSSPGCWAVIVVTYCPSKIAEYPKSKSTQPICLSRWTSLYGSRDLPWSRD